MALSIHCNQSRISHSVFQAMQWMIMISFLGYCCLTSLWSWWQLVCLVWVNFARWTTVLQKIHQRQSIWLTDWRPPWNFEFENRISLIYRSSWMEEIEVRKRSVLRVMIIRFHEAGLLLTFPRSCLASMKLGSKEWSWCWWDVNKSQKMEILYLRNTWVSFLNVSMRMHADVIAGWQMIRLNMKKIGIYE